MRTEDLEWYSRLKKKAVASNVPLLGGDEGKISIAEYSHYRHF